MFNGFGVHSSVSGFKCFTVGGVVQWLRCRSLAGELSLSCTRSMVDRWPLCG